MAAISDIDKTVPPPPPASPSPPGPAPQQKRLAPAGICYGLASGALSLGQVCFMLSSNVTGFGNVGAGEHAAMWGGGIVISVLFAVLSLAGLGYSIRLWLGGVPRGRMMTIVGAAITLGGGAALAGWAFLTRLT